MRNDARCQGEANALENASNGGEERENRVSREVAEALTHSGEGAEKSLVVADGRKEAGVAGRKSSERRRQWRAAAWLLLRVGERESESGRARLAAGAKAGAVRRTWWPTRARPSHRLRATWRPNAAGVPWRRGAAVRAHGRGTSAGTGRG